MLKILTSYKDAFMRFLYILFDVPVNNNYSLLLVNVTYHQEV